MRLVYTTSSLLFLAFVILLPSQKTYAQSLNIGLQPRFEVGIADYEIKLGSSSDTFVLGPDTTVFASKSSVTVSETLPTVSAGVTLFADRFFADFSYQSSYKDDVEALNSIFVNSPDGAFTVDNNDVVIKDFDRNEFALSVGYLINDNTVVFAGYKHVKNEFDNQTGISPANLQTSDGQTIPALFINDFNFDFEYDGPFIGSSFNWPINRSVFNGSLGVNVALGFFSGEIDVSSDNARIDFGNGIIQQIIPSAEQVFETEGDTTGVVIGASWKGATPITGLFYSILVNGYNYNFDADDSGKSDVNETFVNFKVGVSYDF